MFSQDDTKTLPPLSLVDCRKFGRSFPGRQISVRLISPYVMQLPDYKTFARKVFSLSLLGWANSSSGRSSSRMMRNFYIGL